MPLPKMPLVMLTPTKPGLSCKVTVGLIAALAPMLAKLAVALTGVPTGALAGALRLTRMSLASGAMLRAWLLLVPAVSLVALVVAVMLTGVLGCVKLMAALSVAPAAKLAGTGFAKLTRPVAAL